MKIQMMMLLAFLVPLAANAQFFVYKKDNSAIKIFSSQWNDSTKTGLVSFEIESPYKENSVAPGKYDLSKAKGNGVFSSGQNCDIKFEGFIEYTEKTSSSVTPIKMILAGADCKKFVEGFAYKPVVSLPIWRIDSSNGEANLSVRITKTALTECGAGNSFAEKVSDCASKNKKVAKRLVTSDVNSTWTLAAYDEKTTAVWRDDSTKVYWSGPPKVGKGATWQEASDICKADQFLKALPKPKVFEAAVSHGLFKVYPQAGAYWTSETLAMSEDQTLATTYQTMGGQPPDDMTGTLGVPTDIKKKIYFQCVGQ